MPSSEAEYHVGVMIDDLVVRLACFEFLRMQRSIHGSTLPFSLLSKGLVVRGERVPLLGPQGIFKPRVMSLPLSVTTAPPLPGKPRPYEDDFSGDGIIRYRYRGTDPDHVDNRGLQEVRRRRLPLVYLVGISKGIYLPFFPVFVTGDDTDALTFLLSVEDELAMDATLAVAEESQDRRRYLTIAAKKRVHQEGFRARVLHAYREHCAMCRLRHTELLDAAHIIPDSDPRGKPEVYNGLSLCKLHHAAFDSNIVGIHPDKVVVVRSDILEEVDGPMLQHGLKGLQGKKILEPRRAVDQPSVEALEERFAEFKRAV